MGLVCPVRRSANSAARQTYGAAGSPSRAIRISGSCWVPLRGFGALVVVTLVVVTLVVVTLVVVTLVVGTLVVGTLVYGTLVVVTLVVGTLVVGTLVVVTLVVGTLVVGTLGTLVVAEHVATEAQLVQVDLHAGRVNDGGLLQNCRKRLATGDLGHHRRDLATLVDRLCEVIGVHAVLLG